MGDAQSSVAPPAAGEAGLFAALRLVAEEYLAGDGKDLVVGKAFEQRLEEVRLDAHVAVEENHDVVLRGAEAGVRAASEAEVLFERKHADFGVMRAQPVGGAVGRAVVDDQDFAAGMVFDRFEPGRHEAFEEVFTVPVGDDERGGVRVGDALRRLPALARDEPHEVRQRDGEGRDREGGQGEQEPGQRFEEAQQRGLHATRSPPGRLSANARDGSISTAR